MKKNVLIGVMAGGLLFGIGFAAGVYLVEDEVTMEWWFAEVDAERAGETIVATYTNVDHLNEVTNLGSTFMQGEPVDAPPELDTAQPDYVISWNDPSRFIGILTFDVWFTEEGGVYAIRPFDETDEREYKALNQMDADYLTELAEEGSH